MDQQSKRGYCPTDEIEFGEAALPLLRKASKDVFYLINRGYPFIGAVRFAGDHYQLSERQRTAVIRTVSSKKSISSRHKREITDIRGRTLYIDGFNVIIGLEIAFSHSLLFTCMDGTVRDLAGLHGSYKLIPETDMAIGALLESLTELGAGKAVIYLDKPVSNSGKLKERILRLANGPVPETEVLLENSVDDILKTKPLAASGDAVILDNCSEWFNLTRYVISSRIGRYNYIDITPE